MSGALRPCAICGVLFSSPGGYAHADDEHDTTECRDVVVAQWRLASKAAGDAHDALRAILAAWDADRGTSALRNSSALVEAIAQARELVQP